MHNFETFQWHFGNFLENSLSNTSQSMWIRPQADMFLIFNLNYALPDSMSVLKHNPSIT